MYIPPECNKVENVKCYDAFFLPRCNLWFFDGFWHVEENYGLMNRWTYQSSIVYSGTWESSFAMASDIVKTRKLFPVLYSNNNLVKGQW